MSNPTTTHPSSQLLAAFGLGRLDPEQQAFVESHVAQCDHCCEVLRQVPDDTLLAWLRASPTQVHPPEDASSVASEPPGTPGPAGTSRATQPGVAFPSEESASSIEVPEELLQHPRYRIVSTLGRGGMGVVYKAEHRLMERTVALKVINRHFTDNPHVVRRFRREMKNAARLNHPNIVTAYDAEQAGNLHFLVMELVTGKSLAQLLQTRGRLPVAPACDFIRQTALALQHADEKGMVHRDIKPHNLMVTPLPRDKRGSEGAEGGERWGRIKVLDFGLARIVETAQTDGKPATALTQLGTVVGTVPYMPPEQAGCARSVDIRSDIYALGCTFYHLLTGQVPFPEGTALEQMVAHQEQTARPVHRIRKEVPVELSRLIHKMMAKDPNLRFQTPADVVEALTPYTSPSNPQGNASITGTRGGLVPPHPPEPAVPLTPTSSVPSHLPEVAESSDPLNFPDGPPRTPPAPRRRKRAPKKQANLWRIRLALSLLVALFALLLGAGGLYALFSWTSPSGRPTSSTHQQTEPQHPPASPPMPYADNPRVLMVLTPQAFYYPDYEPIRGILTANGITVEVASSQKYATTTFGTPEGQSVKVTCDVLLQDARPERYDAVIFTGAVNGQVRHYCGNSPEARDARTLIKGMIKKNRYVTSICAGGLALAWSGVLKGVPSTGFPDLQGEMRKHGARIEENERVVVSGKIITALDPSCAEDFSRTLIEALRQRP